MGIFVYFGSGYRIVLGYIEVFQGVSKGSWRAKLVIEAIFGPNSF